jgi:hypothetical protein
MKNKPQLSKPRGVNPKHAAKESGKRHTISLDVSEEAYGLVQAYTIICGLKSPEHAALEALESHIRATMQSLDDDESKLLFGLPVEKKEKAAA